MAQITDVLADLIGHAKWVSGEFNIHYAHLDEAETLFSQLSNSRAEAIRECIAAIALAPTQNYSASFEEGWRQAVYAGCDALRALLQQEGE